MRGGARTDYGPQGCQIPAAPPCTSPDPRLGNPQAKTNEIMASMLISLHNINFYQQFMSEIRKNVKSGTFSSFYKKYIELFN